MHSARRATLRSLCRIITKGTTPTTYGHSYTDAGVPFLRVENITDAGTLTLAAVKHVSRTTHDSLGRSHVVPGDILFSIAGAIGRVAVVPSTLAEANLNQAIAIVRLRDDALIDRHFLGHVLRSSNAVASQVAAQSTTLAQANLNLEQLGGLEVPVPPLDEQRRIAAMLSAIDSRCLAGAEVARTATAFKNALLHHEFQMAEQVLLDDVNQSERPICYGILMPGQGHPGGVPVVKVKDIKGGEINLDLLLLTSPELDHQYRRSRLRGGDVLLTIRGTTGRVAVVPPQLDGANITQDTARISVDDPTLRDWIYYALQAPDVQQQIADNTRGQAVKGINIGDVRKLSIPMPTSTERSRVVAVLAATDRLIRSSLAEVAAVVAAKSAVAHRLLGATA